MKSLSNTPISVLDLAKISQEGSISETFKHSKELAQLVEKLGYTRFWLAEHHNLSGIASAATSVLIGYIAENTKTLRVGSGGIMLPNHSPMVIAEQFGTLESLYPNRIDLGLGRAPGTDQRTMKAIRGENAFAERDFGELIEELQFFFAPAEAGQKLRATPGAGLNIPLYILGSSHFSAHLAARLGLPYAFAGHFAPAMMMQAIDIYRREFQPSAKNEKPYVMVGLPVIAAETDERARFLASSVQQAFLGIIRGDRKLSKPPVEDMNMIWNPHEERAVQSMLGLLVTGSVESVRKKLDLFIHDTTADELIISSDTYHPDDRLKSFDLIAKAKGL
jgi:luciferase family oxidoreductase group 1